MADLETPQQGLVEFTEESASRDITPTTGINDPYINNPRRRPREDEEEGDMHAEAGGGSEDGSDLRGTWPGRDSDFGGLAALVLGVTIVALVVRVAAAWMKN